MKSITNSDLPLNCGTLDNIIKTKRERLRNCKDKHGNLLFEGDKVKIDDEEGIYTIVWGEFDDCCVAGEGWVLDPPIYMVTPYYYQNRLEKICL